MDAGTRLAISMHKELAAQCASRNLVFSPISLQIALAMAACGAEGATRQEIVELLSGNKDGAHLASDYSDLALALSNCGEGQELNIANSLWVSNAYRLRPEFEKQCRQSFQAEVESIAYDSPDAPMRINAWVSEKTNHKINHIVDDISRLTGLLLINCVYFYGEWLAPFRPERTEPDIYHATAGDVERQFMRQTGSFGYQETDTFQAIQLRYKAELRDGLTLSIFLPKASSNLKEFVGSLTPQHWKALLQNFKQQEGSLFLPRFRIECSLDGLREALSRLGLNRCFAREADFKGMLQEDVPFWIGDVLQKTYIDVNERGTEAAAVTSTMGFMMAFSKPTERFQIKVDHPFFVSLSDQKTGALLFTASVWEV